MAAINPATTNRLTGMSSGMDTDALVKAMSQNQQTKVDTLFKKMTLAEWRRDAITDVNNLFRSFKDEYTSVMSSKSMMKSETYRAATITSTNDVAVSFKASVGAQSGSYSMKVDQLATGARYVGNKVTSGNVNISTTNQTLDTLFARSDWAEKDIQKTTFTDSKGVQQEGYKIELNGETFAFKGTDKLSDVMNTINNNKKANAQLTYSQISNTFTLSSKETGKESAIDVSEESGDFFKALGLDISDGSSQFETGDDAEFTLNGTPLTQSSNTFTYNGIEFTLNQTSSDFTFKSERDVSKSLETIKGFVETLNGLADTLSKLYNTKQDKKYYPLNDLAKEDMTEAEITKWESKAKEGVLNRDNGLGKVISTLQSLVTAKTGAGSLRDIGITGGQYVPGQPFKLEIDEEKLTKALEEDPDKVYNIFAQTADKTTGNEGGIIARIDAAFDTYTAHTKSFTLQTLRDNINKYGEDIDTQTDKLYIQQEKLYTKFAAFESSMASLNSQSSSIANYFG